MLNLLKRNWWWVLTGLIILVLLKMFWPEQPEQQAPPHEQKTGKIIEPVPPKSSPPMNQHQQIPLPTEATPVVEEDNDNNIEEEEIIQNEEEAPPNKNYILCEHIVSGESQYEFTGQIRLINKGTKPVYGWSVNWEYEDGSTIIEATDVALSGNNPYTGEYLSLNAEIPPGETVTFNFTGIKNGESAPRGVTVKGNFCM